MVVLFTGNGKGKTTAALGQAVRTVGRDRKVLMIQFIKGPWKSGEDFIDITKRDGEKAEFKLVKKGLGFVGILGDRLPREDHANAARDALEYFRKEAAGGQWDLIILDEINVATSLGLLTEGEVLEAVGIIPPDKFVILTGRNAPQSFVDRADLVTEMREIKHPFNDGKMAKIAIEF
ncbi:MAG: cob(I)yrinic acid a,c-diamide adenosyltransferase [Patescibacteria group bacterium]